ncbi:MAG: UDP-N-acetylmuramate--L-alanine ligase [bacterium]
MDVFFRIKNLHFVGIGGIGMSGIAEVLLNQGFHITGSDLQDSEIIERLRQLGAQISIGHQAENIYNAQVVVYSSAVKASNVEYAEAKRLGIPLIPRAEILGELMRLKYGIAIAGTHGKTTTTSMISSIMTEAELDPTFIVGGRVKSLSTNARLGSGQFLVAEADEFDRSFLRLTPTIAVITTLETEHLDCYRDLEDIQNAFIQFAERVPFYGTVVLCIDEPTVAGLIPRLSRSVVTYGYSEQAEVRVLNSVFDQTHTEFQVETRGHTEKFTLNQPGRHNVLNALAAISVALELGIDLKAIRRGLQKFRGVERRFEIKGEPGGVMVVDDYAHHPTEIRATLAAAKQGWNRRVIAVFQPHLYTRTRDFAVDFGASFKDADVILVTKVYGAREEPIPGVTGELIVGAARGFGHQQVYYVPEREEIVPTLLQFVQSGDIVITLGAGDVWKIAKEIVQRLSGEAVSE